MLTNEIGREYRHMLYMHVSTMHPSTTWCICFLSSALSGGKKGTMELSPSIRSFVHLPVCSSRENFADTVTRQPLGRFTPNKIIGTVLACRCATSCSFARRAFGTLSIGQGTLSSDLLVIYWVQKLFILSHLGTISALWGPIKAEVYGFQPLSE